MFKRKFYLAASLLLGSFVTITNLASCAQDVDRFTIVGATNDNTAGSIAFSKNEGTIGETVQVTITVNPGNELTGILVNGVAREKVETSFEFSPLNGTNKVVAIFNGGTEFNPGIKPVQGEYNLHLVFDKTQGQVEASSLKGKAGETVTVTINPAPGYVVTSIELNKKEYGIGTRQFVMQEFKNILKVRFDKKENVQYDWSIEVVPTENGRVEPGAHSGKLGTNVEVTITPNAEFVVEKILFNSKEYSSDCRVFTPVEGVNTIEVKFINVKLLNKIDSGFVISGTLVKDHETDIKTAEEHRSILLEQIKKSDPAFYINDDYIIQRVLYLTENSPLFNELPARIGMTKADIERGFSAYFNESTVKVWKGEYNLQNENDLKIVLDTVKALYDKLSINDWYYFSSVWYFLMIGSIPGVYGPGTPGEGNFAGFTSPKDFAYYMENYGHIEGVKEELVAIDKASTSPYLRYNTKDFYNEEMQKNLYVTVETTYKLLGKFFAISRDTSYLAKNYSLFLKFIQTQGADIQGKEQEYLEMLHFIGRFFTEGLCNKDSFPKFLSIIADLDIQNNDFFVPNRLGYDGYGAIKTNYKGILPELLKDNHKIYRTIKFIGYLIKDISLEELEFVKILFGNPNQQVSVADASIRFAKLFTRTFTNLGREANLVKEAIPGALAQVSTIFKLICSKNNANGYNEGYGYDIFIDSLYGYNNMNGSVVPEFNINFDLVISEIEKASKKDLNALTEADEMYYQEFIQKEILNKVNFRNVRTTFNFRGKTSYKVGEKLDLTLNKIDVNGNVTTTKLTEKDVVGFDTSTKKVGVIEFKLDELKTLLIRYSVGIGTKRLCISNKEINNKGYIPLNYDIKNLQLVDSKTNKVYTPTKISGLDLTKPGYQNVVLEVEGESYYGRFGVFDPSKVYQETRINNFYDVPLGEVIDFSERYYQAGISEYYMFGNEEVELQRIDDLGICEIVSINGVKGNTIKFDKPGKQVATIVDNRNKSFQVSFNAHKVVRTTKRVNSPQLNYFNFRGATRFDDKPMKFVLETSYQFEDCPYGSLTISKPVSLKATDFTNKLDNTSVNGYVNDSYQGYEFGYSLYELLSEITEKNFVGDRYQEFTILSEYDSKMKLSEFSQNLIEANIYRYNQYGSESIYISTLKAYRPVKMETVLDATKIGENSVMINVIDNAQIKSIPFTYYVTDGKYREFQLCNAEECIYKNQLPSDDEIIPVSTYTEVTINLHFSKKESKHIGQLIINDITFKDIKPYINFSLSGEQTIYITYRGKQIPVRIRLM